VSLFKNKKRISSTHTSPISILNAPVFAGQALHLVEVYE